MDDNNENSILTFKPVTLEFIHDLYLRRLKSNLLIKTFGKKIIFDFEKSLEYLSNIKAGLDNESQDQKFKVEISGIGGLSYRLHFDIEKANILISEKKIEYQSIRIDNPTLYTNPKELDHEKLNRYLKSLTIFEPLVTVRHRYIGKLLVIDGNHRLEVAKRRQYEVLNTYILNTCGLYESLCENRSRLFFILHHNLSVLDLYIKNKGLTRLYFRNSFEDNSYYPLPDYRCSS